jgi:excisionase family DNA binding protein
VTAVGRRREPFAPDFEDRLMTVGEVADTMRVSSMTVYRLIKGGELPALRVGRNYRIRQSDVQRFLAERAVRSERPDSGEG